MLRSMPQPNLFLQRLNHWAQTQPDKIAFNGPSGRSLTYFGLLQFCEDLAQVIPLHEQPFICIHLSRGPEKAALVAASISLGIPGFCLEKRSPRLYATNIINKFGPTHLILGVSQFERIKKEITSRVIEIRSLRQCGFAEDILILKLSEQRRHPEKLAWMLLTSGSTGERKGVMISEDALLARTHEEIADFELTRQDRLLNILSFAHDLGLNQLLTSIYSGASLCIRSPLFGADLLQTLKTDDCSGITATPMVWHNLFKFINAQPTAKNEILNGFRYVTVSGGSLESEELVRLKKLFPSAKLICTYGQTETFRSLISVFPPDSFPERIFQRPAAGASLELIGEDLNSESGGATGELVHQGSAMMMGYFGETQADVQLGDLNKIRTGDIFRRRKDGFYEFLGRHDDLIKRQDHRVYLQEIESCLKKLEGVDKVSVIVGQNKKLIAFMTLMPNQKRWSTQEFMIAASAYLPHYMLPDQIILKDQLPLTSAFKIDRAQLRKEMREREI